MYTRPVAWGIKKLHHIPPSYDATFIANHMISQGWVLLGVQEIDGYTELGYLMCWDRSSDPPEITKPEATERPF